MLLDRRDPEFIEIRKARKSNFDQAWRDGLIGDAAYILSLAGLGIRADEIRDDLRALELERSQKFVHPRARAF